MGLDMYLYKRKQFRENDPEYNSLVKETREEVMYWRKANQIRWWLVNHTDLAADDNCRYIPLTKEILEQLRDDCLKVLENHEAAYVIMPSSSGFFFGDTEYDEYYFGKLKYTAENIDQILKSTDFENEVIEYYEWW